MKNLIKILALFIIIASLFTLSACDISKLLNPDDTTDNENTTPGGNEDETDENPDDGEDETDDNTDDDEETASAPTEGLKYTLNEDGKSYSLTGVGTATGTEFVIASEYEGLPVTEIGEEALMTCSTLKAVTIPNTITKINDYAFALCLSLESIEIPKSVTHLGRMVFAGCATLKNIEVSEENEKYYSKNNCIIESASKTLTVGCVSSIIPDDGSVTSIGLWAFCVCSALKSITIPGSIETIGFGAFSGCELLESVTISDGVKIISSEAFYGCVSLTDLAIPNSVTKLGQNAFRNCKQLKNITIPGSVKDTGDCTFSECIALESVTFEEGVSEICYAMFENCSSLKNVSIPNSVTSIFGYAFRGCTALTSIAIPDSVTNLGYNAFLDCTNLQYNEDDNAYYLGNEDNPCVVLIKAKNTSIESCEINNNTKVIYDGAFSDCTKLKEITIPNGVVNIQNEAFSSCTSLVSVIIGNNVKNIGAFAFSKCREVTSVEIPASVTSIGYHAFSYCYKLNTLIFAKNSEIEIVESEAFLNCHDLNYNEYDNAYYLGNEDNKYLVLVKAKDESITSCNVNAATKCISDSAFSGCESLASITISNSVIGVNHLAFSGCTGLESITVASGNTVYHSSGNCLIETENKTLFLGCKNSIIPSDGSVTSIGEYAFKNTEITNITISDGVTSIDYSAFEGCTSLTSLTISDSITYIGINAFGDCTGLTIIDYNGTKAEWQSIMKDSSWNSNTGEYVVHCTDGDLTKAESEIYS